MNPKKGLLNLLLCVIIFVIIAGAGTIIKFGIPTFLTNLFGVALLWGYIALHAVCPDCGTRISVKDAYCKGW